MKLRYFIASIVLFLTSVILNLSLLFIDSLEFEHALIVISLSTLLFAVSVLLLVLGKIIVNAENEKKVKRFFAVVIASINCFVLLFTACAFITCYDSYTPKDLYFTDRDYIQSFFPVKDIADIKTRDDLNDGCLEYSNFPGSTNIKVYSYDKPLSYEMNYISTLNPILKLRYITKTFYYTHFDPYGLSENYSEYVFDNLKIKVYSDNYRMFAYVEKSTELLSVLVNHYESKFATQEEFAEMVNGQIELLSHKDYSNKFRERPWYDILFYLREWNEPYEESKYFLS